MAQTFNNGESLASIRAKLNNHAGEIDDNKAALLDKANDSEVVHLTGDETIADIKTFASSPIVPTPTAGIEVANKQYVDDNAGGAVTSVNGETGVVVLDSDDISDSTTTNKFISQSEIDKLAGIEANAEVNNISDANATDLTDGGASTLHYHVSDRARANHTGTQNINTITGLTDYYLGNTGGTVTTNWDNGLNQEIILNANTTFYFSNPRDGFVHEILLTQDSTVRTVTFPTITWQDGTAPDLSAPSGKYLIQLSYRGTVYYGAVISFNA